MTTVKLFKVFLAVSLCVMLCPASAFGNPAGSSSASSPNEEMVQQDDLMGESGKLPTDENSGESTKIPADEGDSSAMPNGEDADNDKKPESEHELDGAETIAESDEAEAGKSASSAEEQAADPSDSLDNMSVELNQQNGSTKVAVSVPHADEMIQSSRVDSVEIEATMSFNGKTTRSIHFEAELSDFAQNESCVMDFEAYGTFDVVATFLGDGEKVSEYATEFSVVANEYNIAMLSGTLPVLLFSLQTFDSSSVPTMVLLERPDAYNWDNLPDHVYAMPTLTEDEIRRGSSDAGVASNLFRSRAEAVSSYVADLVEANPSATINLYVADYYVGLIQKLIYANKIPESQYSIHMLSDGSFSASRFNSTYSSNAQAKHNSICEKWQQDKESCYKTGGVPSDWSIADKSSSTLRAYAVLSVEGSRCEWDVARKDLFTAGEGDFPSVAQSKITQLSIADMLSRLQGRGDGSVEAFKALYNFNDEYFSAAEEQGKNVMLLLGTRVTMEENFSDYAQLTKAYYGTDDYVYYYKGHPGTPTDFYPQKQEDLDNLGIIDVDSSIAAELILFFYPDISLSGYYGSTTYQSVPEEMAAGLWGQTKADALSSTTADYSIMDWFASPISDTTDAEVRALCPSGHACYLVEFSDEILADSNYSIGVWDATSSSLKYYASNPDGSYVQVGESEGDDSQAIDLAEGNYIIKSDLANRYVLDAKSAGKSNGTKVQLYSSNMTNAQRWNVSYDENGYAIIKNVNSGKVLDMDVKSRNIQLWTDCSTDNQRWTFLRGSGDSVIISSVADPSYHLTVSGGTAKSGVSICASQSGSGSGFEMISYPVSVDPCDQVIDNGFYKFIPSAAAHGLGSVVLDVKSASNKDGANVQLYEANGTWAQVFEVAYVDGYYKITNASSGKVLTLEDGNIAAGTNVSQSSYSSDDSQLWSVRENPDGSVTFINKASGLTLDVSGGKMSNGANVQGYTANGTAAQMWELDRVDGPRELLDRLADQSRNVLPDGTYVVKSALANTQVLDVKSGSVSNSANVQLYESNMTDAQAWKVTHDDSGYVLLQNVKSGKYLDVKSAKRVDETNVQQYEGNGSYAQKWVVEDNGDGTMTIASALWPDVVLDVASGSSKNGANVQIYGSNETKAQKWSFLEVNPQVEPCDDLGISGKWFEISPRGNLSYAIDITSGSSSNGANVQLYKKNNTLAQLFRFDFVKTSGEKGCYQIVNAQSGKALDVTDGNLVPSTNVQQWTASATNDNQLFSAVKNSDGSYTFVNKATGLVLDIKGGAIANKSNIQVYTDNGTAAQKFVLAERTNLLNEGIFKITSALSTSKVVDVKSGSTSNGANVQLYGWNDTFAQKWEVKRVGDNAYTIQSTASGKYLAADANGNVCQRSAASDGSQYWIPSISSGFYVLKNQKSGKVLDVASASTANGANVQVYSANGTNAQRFSFKTVSTVAKGTYHLRSAANSSYVVDVKSGSKSNSANVQLYKANNTGAQKWDMTENSDGSYTIVNSASGKALDVKSAGTANGTNVQQYTKNGTNAQKWNVVYNSDGTFRLVSKLKSDLVLTVSGSAKNGANVMVSKYTGSSLQKFTFEKTTYTPPIPSAQQKMLNKINGYSSKTSYLIAVNLSTHKVGVFTGSKGNWKVKYYWDCVTGASGSPTITGSYYTTGFKRTALTTDSRAKWATQINGGYFFHTILASNSELGKSLSHGCVRLATSNAKWIYNNIKAGTRVVLYR